MPLESEIFTSLVRQAGNHLWQSTAFAAAAFLLALALKATHARVRHWIWLSASIKFLVPFAFLANLGSILGPWIRPSAPAPRIPFAVEQLVQPFALPEQTASVIESSLAGSAAFPLPAVLLAVWSIGFAAIAFRWWNRWRRVSAVVRGSLPLREGREADALRRLRSNGRRHLPGVELVSSPAKLEPGIFGVFRPVLWLPAGIADRLSEAELEAVLAHELCHARRRDNLAAALHMVVEAVFWFHPLVWWLGARLVEERERACDEEVVLLTGEPRAYAEGVLKVCEFYVASPLPCTAGVTGADLRKRIEGIMASRFIGELRFWKKLLLTALLAAAVVCPFTLGVFKAEVQATATSSGPGQHSDKLEFEVASVKPTAVERTRVSRLATSGDLRFGNRIYGDRAEYIYYTLRQLIAEAYQVRPWQVEGPSYLVTDRFDVICKMPAGSRREDTPLMLQSLLADRFKLVLHREFREQSVSALVVGKDGPKFKESVSETPLDPDSAKVWLEKGRAARGNKSAQAGIIIGNTGIRFIWDYATSSVHMEASRMTMAHLADLVMRSALGNGRPVVDMTGLKGNYEVVLDIPMAALEMTSPQGASVSNVASEDPRPAEAAADSGRGGYLRSLKSLGLQLENRKAQVEKLIVDHVEKTPTEN